MPGNPRKHPLRTPPASVLKLHFPWLLTANNQWLRRWAGWLLGDTGLLWWAVLAPALLQAYQPSSKLCTGLTLPSTSLPSLSPSLKISPPWSFGRSTNLPQFISIFSKRHFPKNFLEHFTCLGICFLQDPHMIMLQDILYSQLRF